MNIVSTIVDSSSYWKHKTGMIKIETMKKRLKKKTLKNGFYCSHSIIASGGYEFPDCSLRKDMCWLFCKAFTVSLHDRKEYNIYKKSRRY